MARDKEAHNDSGTQQTERSSADLHEVRCSFCGADAGDVKKMIAGPRGLHVCNECVVLGTSAAGEGQASNSRTTLLRDSTTEEYGQLKRLAEQLGELLAKAEEDAERCSFCSKKFRMLLRPAAAPDVTICLECIDLCLEILYEENVIGGVPGPSGGG
ncbi:hypothetical protein E1287_07345 [Actinomadura sp. KC06]|uniref:ClpX C4-type zinc finger protein n=1 Tax=Actinomadura sp. KC06 TaxID=2530369 RepID=UPI00105079BD|nr:ClpX C4-type zinc finger protein [Actinomadura sp. KC06]TDD37863.1 hypothetical protein E1287_07345 [Actinomadura sp. KC06]